MNESIKILEEVIELAMSTGKVSRKGAVQLDHAIEEVKSVYIGYERVVEENQRLIEERDSYVERLIRIYEENPSLQNEFTDLIGIEGKELKTEQKQTKELKSKPLTK